MSISIGIRFVKQHGIIRGLATMGIILWTCLF